MKSLVATTVLLASLSSFAQTKYLKSIDAIEFVASNKALISQVLEQSNTTEVTAIKVESYSGVEFDMVVTTHAMDVPCLTPITLVTKSGQLVVEKIFKTICKY